MDNTGQRFSINGMVRIEGKTADSYIFLCFPFSLFVLFDPKNKRFRLNYLHMKAESYFLSIFTNKRHFIFFETLPSKEIIEKKDCSKFGIMSILFAFPFFFLGLSW